MDNTKDSTSKLAGELVNGLILTEPIDEEALDLLSSKEIERCTKLLDKYEKNNGQEENVQGWKFTASTLLIEKITEKNRAKLECKAYSNAIQKWNQVYSKLLVNKDRLVLDQKAMRSLVILRLKTERLETQFSMTCDYPAAEMQKRIYAYMRDLKDKATEDISNKLDTLQEKEKEAVLNFFRQDEVKDLAVDMFTKWKTSIEDKINQCDDLNPEVKNTISDLLKTHAQLDSINISQHYPVHFNARFTKWMFYMINSTDKIATEIRNEIKADPELSLFSFCSSIAELYTAGSKIFHPASTFLSEVKVNYREVLTCLENNMEIDDEATLKSASILLKAGSSKAKSASPGEL